MFSMTKDNIIDIIVNHKPYARYCKKMAKDVSLSDDLYQEFILSLLEKTETFLIDIYNKGTLEKYCLGIIWNKSKEIDKVINSNTSNPLLRIANKDSYLNMDYIKSDYNDHKCMISDNYIKVVKFIDSNKKIKQSDKDILISGVNRDLSNMSRNTGIPYVTLVQRKERIKNLIIKNVKI